MKTKVFEIRDSGTFFPAIAIQLEGQNIQEQYLLSRAGYGKVPQEQRQYVLFMHAHDVSRCQYDPFRWGDRTFQTAHEYIKTNWDALAGGDVIDVQYILGETEKPKTSEMFC